MEHRMLRPTSDRLHPDAARLGIRYEVCLECILPRKVILKKDDHMWLGIEVEHLLGRGHVEPLADNDCDTRDGSVQPNENAASPLVLVRTALARRIEKLNVDGAALAAYTGADLRTSDRAEPEASAHGGADPGRQRQLG